MTWTLPVLAKNTCGECTACCTVLPISERDWVKPAGKPCEHLCDKGCSIYGKPEWPNLCAKYLCGWRDITWLGEQPDCRPDRLGIIFQSHEGGNLIAMYEVRPGAAYEEKVCLVVCKMLRKYKGRDRLRINLYPYGGPQWMNEEIARIQGFHADQINWTYRKEPYDHFVLETVVDGTAAHNARFILDFFTRYAYLAEAENCRCLSLRHRL